MTMTMTMKCFYWDTRKYSIICHIYNAYKYTVMANTFLSKQITYTIHRAYK